MQKIEYIDVKDLILWTENPRDPISTRSKNQNVIHQALEDTHKKWRLPALARAMGAYYDYSELPIVVYKNGIPVVYDGNRRVILAMLKLGLYPDCSIKFRMPECDVSMPCCVADEKTALDSVWRKHAETGSWDQISRDVFLHKFRKKEKPILLQLDEMYDGRFSGNRQLNSRFADEEVFTPSRLRDVGIRFDNGQLKSRHNSDDTRRIIEKVVDLVEKKELTTRKDRNTPLRELIGADLRAIVDRDSGKEFQCVELRKSLAEWGVTGDRQEPESASPQTERLPRRVQSSTIDLFGGKLSLRAGEPANLYRDILDLYNYYIEHKGKLSDRFPALIRMALRLECELIASCSSSSGFEAIVKEDFDKIKQFLTRDQKTFLVQNSVSKENIIPLLHTGAHNYTGSFNLQQTIAMSLIVAGLLRLHCGANANG